MMPIRSGPAKVGDVSPEVLVLALSTVIRPTATAAVFAMLAAARPTRLLLAYIIAGAAFSGGFGVVVVILLSGWTRPEAQDDVRAVIGIVVGAVSLGYAAGLNAITNSTSSIVEQIFQVAVYNGFWFALPTAALVLATRRPVELQDFLRRVTGWVSHREREILVTAFGLLGTYLIVKGVVELLP